MERPPFIEGGVAPSMAAAAAVEYCSEFVGRGRRRSSSSSFPLKDDAGYIGYLTDGEEEADEDSVIRRRRRELIGSDVSFSNCMLMMIIACGLMMLFLFAVSPWGIPSPRRL